jgi:hypothetical protein
MKYVAVAALFLTAAALPIAVLDPRGWRNGA